MIDLAFASLRSSVLILLGLLGVGVLLRGRSAAIRHHALRVLLVAACAVPVATSFLALAPKPVAVTVSAEAVQAAPVWFPTTALPEGSYRLRTPGHAELWQDFRAQMAALGIGTAVQLAGSLLFWFPGWRAWKRLRRIETTAVPLDAFGGIPVLRATDACLEVPVAYGRASHLPAGHRLAARIILPAASTDWTEARVHAALLHEAAHVRRGDWTWIQSSRSIAVFYWFSPAFFLLAHALRSTAEGAADDAVVAAGVRPSDYARELLAVAARTSGLDAAVLAMVGRGGLRDRVAAILAPRRDRRRATARLGIGAGAAFGGLGLGLASLGARLDRLALPTPPGAIETEKGYATLPDGNQLFLDAMQDVTMDRIVAWNRYGFATETPTLFPWHAFPVGEKAGYTTFSANFRSPDPDPGVAFRLPASFHGQASGVLRNPGTQQFEAYVVTPRIETSALSGDLAVGVATGPWQRTEMRPVPEGGRHLDPHRLHSVEFELPPFARDAQFRAVAYSGTGRRLSPDGDIQPQDPEGTDHPHVAFGVRLAPSERVARIVVEFRPYRWIVFRDVTLHPGRDALAAAHHPRLRRNVYEHGRIVDYTVVGEAGR